MRPTGRHVNRNHPLPRLADRLPEPTPSATRYRPLPVRGGVDGRSPRCRLCGGTVRLRVVTVSKGSEARRDFASERAQERVETYEEIDSDRGRGAGVCGALGGSSGGRQAGNRIRSQTTNTCTDIEDPNEHMVTLDFEVSLHEHDNHLVAHVRRRLGSPGTFNVPQSGAATTGNTTARTPRSSPSPSVHPHQASPNDAPGSGKNRAAR